MGGFESRVADDLRRYVGRGRHDLVAGRHQALVVAVGGSLLPPVVLDEGRVVVAEGVAVVGVTGGDVGVRGVVEDVALDRLVGAAVVGVDVLAQAPLVVDDVAGDLLAVGQGGARQSLGVDAAAVVEHLHVVEDQVVADRVVVAGVGGRRVADLVGPAAPAERDGAVADVVDLVVGDRGALGPAVEDRHAAVELAGQTIEVIVRHLDSGGGGLPVH
ncbi:hypothetical protein [Streptomyces mirabilis]|uniref:hypothetical protein n=1 Tax=Streptomyces mirabilis TaxID=68239 RepID=UPI003D9E6731